MKPQAIHQFHGGSAYGDGITNGMLFIQRMLKEAGYESEIYCVHVDPKLSESIRSFRDLVLRHQDLIFVHYSIGHDQHRWIDEISTRKILIYHNITPAELLPSGSEIRLYAERGRDQLRAWGRSHSFAGAIADSAYNARELEEFGFSSVATIPLLVDLDHIRQHPWNRKLSSEINGARNLLFLGQWSEHKGQINLIRMMDSLRRCCQEPVRLILGGGVTSATYLEQIRAEISSLGLGGNVLALEKLADEDVFALFRTVDLYVSMSNHEGFGMPLVESMAFGLPVLAFATGAIPSTLGTGGLLVETRDPEYVAACAKLILQEPWLRREIVRAQSRELERYERAELIGSLQRFLNKLDIDVGGLTITSTTAKRSYSGTKRSNWQIEGPFDSSYSLAIVNRELASALSEQGKKVTLVSRDGPGPFEPNKKFLADHPSIAAMWRAGRDDSEPTVALRDLYPPDVSAFRGELRGMSCYAWEESGFPIEYVRAFNGQLNHITVLSRYVAKVLRDNGVRVPIRVVGTGVDQMVRRANQIDAKSRTFVQSLALGNDFCFLHVSSCLPRKGVDVLLAAWIEAFTRADNVVLVIKATPNQHHAIEEEVAKLDKLGPDHARVVVINKDISEQDVYELFRAADAVVCPSRGEGFGLPLAEALALGKSIITTRFGGQMDFCSDDTAWLCDFEFDYARTHLSVPNSVWVEPLLDSLISCLRGVWAATPEERARRIEAGRARVLSRFQWKDVAARVIRAVDDVQTLDARAIRLPKVGWVSTWNSRCGVADYSKSLSCEIPFERLVVFANRNAALLEPDAANVVRCWEQGWSDPLNELYQAIVTANVEALVVQFNFGFFHLEALARLIERLSDQRIPVYLVLHSTADVKKPDLSISLSSARHALALARRLLVHSVDDLNRLKDFGLVDNVAMLPFGAPLPPRERPLISRSRERVVASFGYLLPHKGVRELIEACAMLRREFPNMRLLMLNALYPAEESQAEFKACREAIARNGLEKRATLKTDYLGEQQVLEQLAGADLVVYPYQNTQESASAAVRLGLASLTPVACTPLPIFGNVAAVTHRLPGCSAGELAHGISSLLSDNKELFRLAEAQREWVRAVSWPVISERLYGLIRGEYVESLLPRTDFF